jgi:hypothetical protein
MAYLGTPIDTQNQFQSLQGKRFSGDGSTTAFTLDIAPSSVFDIEVFVENVRQDPNSAYGISGTTLTFTGAPPSGTNNIYVVHQAKAVGTIDVPASGVVPASLASNIISGQTELAATPADTDEFLISDAGTIKRIDFSHIKVSNTPAFFVFKNSNMSEIGHLTTTKITFGNEDLDTDNAFDSSTNYRFTPQTAGKYMIGLTARLEQNDGGATKLEEAQVHIYKNGSVYAEAKVDFDANEIKSFNPYVTAIVDFNGSSDYVEGFFTIHTSANSNGRLVGSSNRATYMFGYKIIGA